MHLHFVTSEADSGPGSLREAIETGYEDKILLLTVPKVKLDKGLSIVDHESLVIHSQHGTAISGAKVTFSNCNKLLVSRIAFKLGMVFGDLDSCALLDCTAVSMTDCTFMWSIDECLDVVGCEDVLIKDCVLAEPLRDPHKFNPNVGHSKGPHPLIARFEGNNITVTDCLFAHQDYRPIFRGKNILYKNNIQYNCGSSDPIIIMPNDNGPYEIANVRIESGANTVFKDPALSSFRSMRIYNSNPVANPLVVRYHNVKGYGLGNSADCHVRKPPSIMADVSSDPSKFTLWDKQVINTDELKNRWYTKVLYDDDAMRIRDELFTGTGQIRDIPPEH